MRTLWGTTALAAVMSLTGAGAAQAQDGVQYAENEEVTVSATRTEADTFEVPGAVSVITEQEIEDNLVTDIKDLVRFEPGVSVRNSPARISAQAGTGRDGNSGFNIRGLEDNRVLLMIDGVRVPDGFSFGPANFGRGDYVDLDLLSRVEIVRGPASALYGSDGVAGVVSFITKDPVDFLAGEQYGARLRAQYSSADDSWAEGVSAGGQGGNWSALVAYTRRDGHEQENQGENEAQNNTRTAPNPQDIESNAAMARLVFDPNEANRFRLTYDYSDREVTTEVYTARNSVPAVPPFQNVLDFDAFDTSERQRIAFDHTWENEGGVIDRVFWALYYQTANITEFHAEDRSLTDRTRLTTFDNDVWGVTGQLESEFATGGIEHHLIYGGDYSLTGQESIRDGILPSGEVFPTRPFPITDYTLAGVFVQDEITLLDGSLMLFPAVRYDSYEIEPEDDALYPLAVVGQSDSRITPRFGVVAWPTQHLGVFFNYAQGFKAPAPSQVNQSFTNATQFYTSIPNPNLRPETSESFEVGVRLRDINALGGSWRASANAFVGDYEDFIEQVHVSGPPMGGGSPGNLTVFQVINVGDVTIDGLDGRIDGSWENGLGFTAAVSYAEGEQTELGVTTPLESIDPFRIVAGLTYDDPNGRWGGQLIATHAAQKQADATAPGNFRPDAFTILDVTAYWNVTDRATLRAGVFNVTDETYWWWSDVRGVLASSTTRDAYTQPGTNFSASISYRF